MVTLHTLNFIHCKISCKWNLRMLRNFCNIRSIFIWNKENFIGTILHHCLMQFFFQGERIQSGHIVEIGVLPLDPLNRRSTSSLLHIYLWVFPETRTFTATSSFLLSHKIKLSQKQLVYSILHSGGNILSLTNTLSSNTGVSMVSAPWRLKHLMIVLNTPSRMAICWGL